MVHFMYLTTVKTIYTIENIFQAPVAFPAVGVDAGGTGHDRVVGSRTLPHSLISRSHYEVFFSPLLLPEFKVHSEGTINTMKRELVCVLLLFGAALSLSSQVRGLCLEPAMYPRWTQEPPRGLCPSTGVQQKSVGMDPLCLGCSAFRVRRHLFRLG